MMDEQHKNQADALRIFYDVQEAIRMNIPEEEILAMLYQHAVIFPPRDRSRM